jgi:1-phosphatidylinositol-3-phosphate 5-kinase
VLLVEKSVSPYAQEILANEISLILNVKKHLLERISRCTGAQIVSSVDRIGGAQLGRCRAFHVEKVKHHPSTKSPKSKTLMFFEGCPRRLGCTVINSFLIIFLFHEEFQIFWHVLEKNAKHTWLRVLS